MRPNKSHTNFLTQRARTRILLYISLVGNARYFFHIILQILHPFLVLLSLLMSTSPLTHLFYLHHIALLCQYLSVISFITAQTHLSNVIKLHRNSLYHLCYLNLSPVRIPPRYSIWLNSKNQKYVKFQLITEI